ncbi:MAG: glycoside hydrolase family 28 protein [candidate division KSB1 bacterium]|nr:glycoside hydrolase family 28 protein [candidate division KSB1 bacterium]
MKDYRHLFQLLISIISLFLCVLPLRGVTCDCYWENVPFILEQIQPPEFPPVDFLITDYGAVGDGITDNTQAINDAVTDCHNAGGGRVVIPADTFLTGAIHLQSNVNLHLEENAFLHFSQDPADYLPVVYTRFEGMECMNYSPFIYAYEQENIAITGSGVINGQAGDTVWWPWKENGHVESKAILEDMAEAGVPVEERVFGDGYYLRPPLIQPYSCDNVLIEGVTLLNSPFWVVHPVLSNNVTIRGLTINSLGPNNDGCNPESCSYVLIEDCYFNNGDDCIALKSGRNADGRRVDVACENVVVRNCHMQAGHGGIVMGSECTGDIRNLYVENCTMGHPNLKRALRIKTNSVRGGIIENIHFRNVHISDVGEAVFKVNFYYGEGDVGAYTPIVRDIILENVTSESSYWGLWLKGYERSPVDDVRLIGCEFNRVQRGDYIENVTHLQEFPLDTELPEIAVLTNSAHNQLRIEFDECVRTHAAETIANYSISPAIPVYQAVLQDDHKTTLLYTGEHASDSVYTLSVNEIADCAGDANLIAPGTSLNYSFTTSVRVFDLTPVNYAIAPLTDGSVCYTDRETAVTDIPDSYQNSTLIRTAYADRMSDSANAMSFIVKQAVTVTVAYENGASLPDWLQDWQSTGETVQTADGTMQCLQKEFPAGQVQLDGNQGADGSRMYFVLLQSSSGADKAALRVQCYLEGAFDAGAGHMVAGFETPEQSPYDADSRIVFSNIDDIIDWLFVRLHDPATGSVVQTACALLRGDGMLIDPVVNEPQLLLQVPKGQYDISLVHRSHIAVQSLNPVTLQDAEPANIDFRLAAACLDADRIKLLQPDSLFYGLISGDSDQNGSVTTRDYTEWLNAAQRQEKYSDCDFNMDGVLNQADFDLWLANARAGY